MSEPLRVGISTCPNDTFTFHALLKKRIEAPFPMSIELLDVEQLNQRMDRGEFDVAKVSFHAALRWGEKIRVLPSGSALGFGVGPVLLSPIPGALQPHFDGRPARVLCPGEWTTASLLYQLFHEGHGQVSQCVFSEILEALATKEADYGVCIHEGRFVYKERGLHLTEDLGATWEARTGCPLPLGGIVGRSDLGEAKLQQVQQLIRTSLEYGQQHRDDALLTMREHAQELNDSVLWSHVELYVNDWTADLGDSGRGALQALGEVARQAGVTTGAGPLLEVLPS